MVHFIPASFDLVSLTFLIEFLFSSTVISLFLKSLSIYLGA